MVYLKVELVRTEFNAEQAESEQRGTLETTSVHLLQYHSVQVCKKIATLTGK